MSHVHERDVTDHGDGKDVIDHETEGCHRSRDRGMS